MNERGSFLYWYLLFFVSVFGPFSRAEPETLSAIVNPLSAPAAEQRWNFHFQSTVVPQGHAALQSPPTGLGNLNGNAELNTSVTSTLYVGASPWNGTEFYFDPEGGAGSGISKTQGIAAFTNGEIYRVDDPAPKFYVARAFWRQTIGFGGEREKLGSDQNQLAKSQDSSRMVVTVGKINLPDLFDDNAYSHDPRTQFLNWGLMANGAWDVASDTRGYTWAIALEFNQPHWAIRGAVAAVPTVANGAQFDFNLAHAHGDNLEFEYRYALFGHPAKLRALAFANHADMGSYRETIATPSYDMDITRSRAYRTRYGLGLNLEQELTADLGMFARLGWNDGASETWDYTEMDQTASIGFSLKGASWQRPQDTFGIGFVMGGLSKDHRDYLALGGSGFMLGGGLADYGVEMVVEAYYSLNILSGLSLSADYQQVLNPGYDRTRPTLGVAAARLHMEI